MEDIPQWMQEHIDSDLSFQKEYSDSRIKFMEEILPGLATKDDLKLLATEESLREMIHTYKNFEQAKVLISGGGRWGYSVLLIIAGLIGATVTIVGGWKYLIALFLVSK